MLAAVLVISAPQWPAPLAFAPESLVANLGTSHTTTPSVYYGVYVPGWLSDLSRVAQFEADAGKPAAMVMWYQGWGQQDGSQNFQPAWMDGVRAHGSIPLISWEPWLYTASVRQPQYALRNIIAGAFDPYITAWAAVSKAWGHPYFLRFAAEMNGNWFPWCEQVNGNAVGEYVQAWRHVHDIFVAQGATNVTWVWSPNVEYGGSTPLAGLYPGDAYVDWLGIDGYNWGSGFPGKSWQTFPAVFGPTYAALTQLSTSKPIMIAETASAEAGGSKADWITDAFATQIPRHFPRIRALVWFNEQKETDWRIESSPSAQAAFARAIAAPLYVSNRYRNLSASPIPPP
jgi:beta-mannanase